jgi:hypothetical protein
MTIGTGHRGNPHRYFFTPFKLELMGVEGLPEAADLKSALDNFLGEAEAWIAKDVAKFKKALERFASSGSSDGSGEAGGLPVDDPLGN